MTILYDLVQLPRLVAAWDVLRWTDSGGAVAMGPVLEPAELTSRVSGKILAGDLLSMNGTDFKVSDVYLASADYMTTHITASGFQTLVLRLTDPTGAVAPIYVLLPPDNATVDNGRIDPGAPRYLLEITITDIEKISSAYDIRDFDENNVEIRRAPCFVTGTLIETPSGPRPVEALRAGDLVITRGCGAAPIRWIGGTQLSAADLINNPKLYPIRITAGALGAGVPSRALCLSPQHRVLARSPIARRIAGSDEVLIAAKDLLGLPGVERYLPPEGVGYWHIMFDQHQIVMSNGAETESLYAGPMALAALNPEARAELLTLFPSLAAPGALAPTPARPFLKGPPARKLVERQIKNRKPLVSAMEQSLSRA